MATYKKDASINNGHLSATEFYKYGSSLLSIKTTAIDLEVLQLNGNIQTQVTGNDGYILSDHSGNTRVIVSDKKIQHSSDGITVDYYTADVKNANYYSTYGAISKTYGSTPVLAFNGQRKSTEISADAQTAEFWEYNGDVGRRWNVDPVVKFFISNYVVYSNNPISIMDINGADTIDVKSKTYDVNGFKSGDKGFNKSNMMLLFTAHTDERSGKDKLGSPIEIRRQIASDRFNNQYSISGAIAIGTLDGESISRKPATILAINKKPSSAFFDAITYVTIETLESLRKDAVQTLSKSKLGWLFGGGFDKMRYFNGGKKYDIKSNLLRNRSFSYVEGIGIMESDYIGNMFYGSVMGNFQSLGASLHDGDFLQDSGVDDAFDSHAIILGHRYGKSAISTKTFKSISNIILEKMTISNGKFYHTYDIGDQNKSFEIKVNN